MSQKISSGLMETTVLQDSMTIFERLKHQLMPSTKIVCRWVMTDSGTMLSAQRKTCTFARRIHIQEPIVSLIKFISFLQIKVSACGGVCPTGWTMQDCHCFKIIQTAATWEDAEVNCIKNNGYLAAVTSQEIQDRLVCLESAEDFWIGLNDKAEEASYVWPNGEEYGAFTNWATVPHVTSASKQYVKAVKTTGKWENVDGTAQLKYACEIDLNVRVRKAGTDLMLDS